MTRVVLLDAGPLGRIAHPKVNLDIANWFRALVNSGVDVRVPEIADYEVRRNLILESLTESIGKLDALTRVLGYEALSTDVMRLAAQLWAEARRGGYVTAPKEALDGDVILAAQANTLRSTGVDAVIATENIGHLSRYTTALLWNEIHP